MSEHDGDGRSRGAKASSSFWDHAKALGSGFIEGFGHVVGGRPAGPKGVVHRSPKNEDPVAGEAGDEADWSSGGTGGGTVVFKKPNRAAPGTFDYWKTTGDGATLHILRVEHASCPDGILILTCMPTASPAAQAAAMRDPANKVP